jgi:hemoglobin/transferrin/lactoferrin receptor protein
MYKSTHSPAWFKKSLLVTSLLAAIYQTTAGAADTTAHTTTSDASLDSSEQMTVTAPAPLLKAGSEHSVSAQELRTKGQRFWFRHALRTANQRDRRQRRLG